MASSFVLYGRPNSSNVQKCLWLMTEAKIDFKNIPAGGTNELNRDNPGTLTKVYSFVGIKMFSIIEFRKISPTGLVPVLTHGDFVLDESNTILRYIDATLDHPFTGKTPKDQAQVSKFQDYCHTVEGHMKFMFWSQTRGMTFPKEMLDEAAKQANICFSYLNDVLENKTFLALDRLTLADITIGAQLNRYFKLKMERPKLPNLERYYQTLLKNENYVQLIVRVFDQDLEKAKKN